MEQITDIQAAAEHALSCCNPTEKVALTQELAERVMSAQLAFVHTRAFQLFEQPGRPDRPELVPPAKLGQRKLGSVQGRAALIHAVAHIEFNAINLAWDAIYRFANMPQRYYTDWASVALDEARHFALLATRLAQLGYEYGDFPAHNGLWDTACATRDDVLERMALVPRMLEARGLDVTPGMIQRLRSVGDFETAGILAVILDEEVRHVAIGSFWFAELCAQRGLIPEDCFIALLRKRGTWPRPPFNAPARLSAGFTASELEILEQLARVS